jgi:hypothetical protein
MCGLRWVAQAIHFTMMDNYRAERTVLVHTADSIAEAMVIRGLLESAGIRSPGSATSNPFPVPMRESPGGVHGVDVFALESQAEEARSLIAEYFRAGANAEDDDTDSSDPQDQ